MYFLVKKWIYVCVYIREAGIFMHQIIQLHIRILIEDIEIHFGRKKGLGYNKNITLCSRLRIHYRLGTLPNKIRMYIENECPELLNEVDKFKLGNVRNLKDYEKLIGFSFMTEQKI